MKASQDRETESRFGATPVPGKMGAAMASTGLHGPPPRPSFHNQLAGGGAAGGAPGAPGTTGNQLYVGNVSYFSIPSWQRDFSTAMSVAVPSRMARFEGPIPFCGEHHPS